MAGQWLLVEWVDERKMFPYYGVVSAMVVSEETDLQPGKLIFVRAKHAGNSVRRAQVLRISDDKRQMKEQKLLLERQDQQVQNMLSLCMRTIKEIKTEPLYGALNGSQQILNTSSGSNIVPIAPVANSDSSSDSDSEPNKQQVHQQIFHTTVNKSGIKTPAEKKYTESPINSHSSQNVQLQKQAFITSSTPILLPLPPRKPKPLLTFDQATQTDDLPSDRDHKVEEVELLLNRLYQQFLSLVARLQLDSPELPTYYSDAENNETVHNEVEHAPEAAVQDASLNNARVEPEDLRRSVVKPVQVRRVSAQTTNTVEPNFPVVDRNDMVALGAGYVTVPARLMNEINWDSYSSATRQLLQAVFPRKVLATHSLTGKQSPAFANKPAKKCLDPKLIEDIVNTVSERCGVPKRSVRNCVTIKCVDEAKLYRNRLQGRVRNQVTTNQDNQENVPPSPMSTRDSSIGTD